MLKQLTFGGGFKSHATMNEVKLAPSSILQQCMRAAAMVLMHIATRQGVNRIKVKQARITWVCLAGLHLERL